MIAVAAAALAALIWAERRVSARPQCSGTWVALSKERQAAYLAMNWSQPVKDSIRKWGGFCSSGSSSVTYVGTSGAITQPSQVPNAGPANVSGGAITMPSQLDL